MTTTNSNKQLRFNLPLSTHSLNEPSTVSQFVDGSNSSSMIQETSSVAVQNVSNSVKNSTENQSSVENTNDQSEMQIATTQIVSNNNNMNFLNDENSNMSFVEGGADLNTTLASSNTTGLIDENLNEESCSDEEPENLDLDKISYQEVENQVNEKIKAVASTTFRTLNSKNVENFSSILNDGSSTVSDPDFDCHYDIRLNKKIIKNLKLTIGIFYYLNLYNIYKYI